uniref:Uncharacterized protein n=1 Tax=Anopheles melas TaxID=34690 RepID=A0A182UKI5_9DIPT
MDGSSSTAGDYQSLPTMITAAASAINHTTTGHHHAQYPSYHQQQHYHQQQQLHYQYTPYPNGPPPSYDTVVAQDELLASRRKRAYDALPADDTHHTQEDGEQDVGQSSSRRCSNHELHECDKQSVCGDGATPPLLPKASRPPGNGDVSVASIVRRPYSDDPDEPTLCRSVVEADWSEEDHHRTSCNCPAVVATSGGGEGSIAGPPIYCRNCGYFVATGSPALERRHHRRNHRRNLPIERTRNETLLVDYETPASDVINRNSVTDDGGTGQTVDTVDIDMRTTMQMVASSSTGPSGRYDTMNNNASTNSAANETQSSPAASNLSTAPPPQQSLASAASRRSGSFFGAANSANNNIIIDCSVVIHGDAAPVTGDIIHQCPTTSNQCSNQLDSYLEPGTGDRNGNTDTAVAPVQPATGPSPSSSGSPGSLLNENGLVRLDMSQIIDNTGLPTYEAALKLESSGYV